MKINRGILAVLAGGVVAAGVGCSSSSSRLPVYDSSQVGTVIKSQGGEVLSVRDVLIKAASSQAGSTGMGSRIGAAAGRSAIYGGPSAAIGAAGAVVGEAVGAIAGARAGDDRVGEEIVIAVEGGGTVTIVQERSNPPLAQGEKVRIVTGASTGRYGTGGDTKVVREEEVATSTTSSERSR